MKRERHCPGVPQRETEIVTVKSPQTQRKQGVPPSWETTDNREGGDRCSGGDEEHVLFLNKGGQGLGGGAEGEAEAGAGAGGGVRGEAGVGHVKFINSRVSHNYLMKMRNKVT